MTGTGWNDLLTKYGTITLARALAPAIELAEHGFRQPRRPRRADFAKR